MKEEHFKALNDLYILGFITLDEMNETIIKFTDYYNSVQIKK